MKTAEEIYRNVSRLLQAENQNASELWERVRQDLSARDGGLNKSLLTLDTIFEQYNENCQKIINNLNEE